MKPYFEYDMVLTDLVYIIKLAPKQAILFRCILINIKQCSVKEKFCSVKRKLCTVNGKCGTAKIYGLRLEFSNSNSSANIFLMLA